MKIEQQVTSLELSKRLKELGVKQESLFWWRLMYSVSESFDKGVSLGKKGIFGDYCIEYLPRPQFTTADIKWNESDLAKLNETELSAFTVAELGEMLCKDYYIHSHFNEDSNEWYCAAFLPIASGVATRTEWGQVEADARAKMLIYLLENKLI